MLLHARSEGFGAVYGVIKRKKREGKRREEKGAGGEERKAKESEYKLTVLSA
jgi:hypothetical protein